MARAISFVGRALKVAFVVDGVLNVDGRVKGGVVLVDHENDFAVVAVLDDEVVFDFALKLAAEQHAAGSAGGPGRRSKSGPWPGQRLFCRRERGRRAR